MLWIYVSVNMAEERIQEIILIQILMFCLGQCEYTQQPWGRVMANKEYCDYETFQATCSKDETVIISVAKYGQMGIGKCVEFDTGHLGCEVDVTGILQNQCLGEVSCEIQVDDDIFRQTSPCRKGVLVYLQASYICAKVIPMENLCKEIPAQITTTYIASTQASSAPCTKATGLYSQEFTISSMPGQNIKFTLINLSLAHTEGFGSQSTRQELGYIMDSDSDAITPITMGGRVDSIITTSKTNKASVYLSATPGRTFLIGFQAYGCPNLKVSSELTIRRENDKLTVGCPNSKQTWQLKCQGTHWIGVIGNCSFAQPVAAKVEERIEYAWGSVLPKDIILAIIGCATLFIAIFVVTVGYVCLKWPSERRKQSLKNKQDYQTMSKAKAYLSGGSDIVYLAPTQGNTVNVQPQSDYQPIWQKPLPTVPNTEPTTLRVTTTKRNNEDVYNMSLSSNSTDYEKKKYFVLDKDYMNTTELQQTSA